MFKHAFAKGNTLEVYMGKLIKLLLRRLCFAVAIMQFIHVHPVHPGFTMWQ